MRQTARGAAISVRIDGEMDTAELCAALEGELRRLSVPQPLVTVEIVQSFDRQSTGKFKRFIPLATG